MARKQPPARVKFPDTRWGSRTVKREDLAKYMRHNSDGFADLPDGSLVVWAHDVLGRCWYLGEDERDCRFVSGDVADVLTSVVHGPVREGFAEAVAVAAAEGRNIG